MPRSSNLDADSVAMGGRPDYRMGADATMIPAIAQWDLIGVTMKHHVPTTVVYLRHGIGMKGNIGKGHPVFRILRGVHPESFDQAHDKLRRRTRNDSRHLPRVVSLLENEDRVRAIVGKDAPCAARQGARMARSEANPAVKLEGLPLAGIQHLRILIVVSRYRHRGHELIPACSLYGKRRHGRAPFLSTATTWTPAQPRGHVFRLATQVIRGWVVRDGLLMERPRRKNADCPGKYFRVYRQSIAHIFHTAPGAFLRVTRWGPS